MVLQTLPARDVEDGKRRGSEPSDVVLAGASRTHLLVPWQQPREHEHGHACHAAGQQDTRCARAAVGLGHSQG